MLAACRHTNEEGIQNEKFINFFFFRKDWKGYTKPGDYSVEFVTSEATETKPRSPVKEFFPHPHFAWGVVDDTQPFLIHDIALIKLKQKVECDEFANPICLPPAGFGVEPGTVSYIAGWGDFKPGVSGKNSVNIILNDTFFLHFFIYRVWFKKMSESQ